MSVNFELPRITADDPGGQLAQMRSYLWQLVEKLNYAFNYIDIDGEKEPASEVKKSIAPDGVTVSSVQTFNGTNYKATVRTWSNGLKEAFIKTEQSSFELTTQRGSLWTMPSAYQLSPLPPGFGKDNLIACHASLIGQNANAAAYVFYVSDAQLRVNIFSPQEASGLSALKGNIVVYLAAQ